MYIYLILDVYYTVIFMFGNCCNINVVGVMLELSQMKQPVSVVTVFYQNLKPSRLKSVQYKTIQQGVETSEWGDSLHILPAWQDHNQG